MKLLALEASTKNFSLAIFKENKVLKESNVILKEVLSDSIIPGIERILSDAGISLKDLSGFVIGLGPGSFTSLRVGLATLKALNLATGKPLVGIPSPDALAWGVKDYKKEEVSLICTLSDARRNLIYACLYQKKDSQLKRITGYQLTTLDKILKQLSRGTACRAPALFVGDGIQLYREEIIKKFQINVGARHAVPLRYTPLFAKEEDWYPKAKHLLSLALDRFRKKKFDNVDQLVPLYLYPQDCQVERK